MTDSTSLTHCNTCRKKTWHDLVERGLKWWTWRCRVCKRTHKTSVEE